jgi:hypothetical protein
MRKTRLNKAHRSRLRQLFNEIVKCPAEESALALAYQKAEPLVRATVVAEYPPKDMKVLERYEVATQDDCVKLRLTRGGDVLFRFKPQTGPIVPDGAATYSGKFFLTDEQTTKAVEEWDKATKGLEKALHAKKTDYDALIDTALFFEDVTAIWVEAEKIRPVITKQLTALVALNPTIIQRIKADVQARVKQ